MGHVYEAAWYLRGMIFGQHDMAYMKTYCLCYEYTVQSLCSYQENPSALLWFYVTKFVVKKEEPKSVNNNNYLVDRYLLQQPWFVVKAISSKRRAAFAQYHVTTTGQ